MLFARSLKHWERLQPKLPVLVVEVRHEQPLFHASVACSHCHKAEIQSVFMGRCTKGV